MNPMDPDTLAQLEALCVDFQNEQVIGQLTRVVETLYLTSPDSLVGLLAATRSENLQLVLLSFLKKRWTPNLHPLGEAPVTSLFKLLGDLIQTKNTTPVYKLLVEFIAQIFVLTANNGQVFDYCWAQISAIRAVLTPESPYFLASLDFFALFVSEVKDVILHVDFGRVGGSKFKNRIYFFRIKAMRLFGQLMLDLARACVAGMEALDKTPLARHLESCLYATLTFMTVDEFYGYKFSDLDAIFKVRRHDKLFANTIKGSHLDSNFFCASSDLAEFVCSIFSCPRLRTAPNWASLLETTLKILFAFLASPPALFTNPDFRKEKVQAMVEYVLDLVAREGLFAVAEAQKEQNESISKLIGMLLTFSLGGCVEDFPQGTPATVPTSFQGFHEVIVRQAITSFFAQETLSGAWTTNFCFFLNKIATRSPQLLSQVVAGAETKFIQQLFASFQLMVVTELSSTEVQPSESAEEIGQAARAFALLVLTLQIAQVDQFILAIAQDPNQISVACLFFLTFGVLRSVEDQELVTRNTHSFTLLVSLCQKSFVTFLDLSKNPTAFPADSKLLLLLHGFAMLTQDFKTRMFSWGCKPAAEIVDFIPVLQHRAINFIVICFTFFAFSVPFPAGLLGRLWELKVAWLNSIFDDVSLYGDDGVKVRNLKLEREEFPWLLRFHLDHQSMCNLQHFEHQPVEAEKYYAVLTRIVSVVLSQNKSFQESAADFQAYLRPLQELGNFNLTYFTTVVKGMINDLKGGMQLPFMKEIGERVLAVIPKRISVDLEGTLDLVGLFLKDSFFHYLPRDCTIKYMNQFEGAVKSGLREMDMQWSQRTAVVATDSQRIDHIVAPLNSLSFLIQRYLNRYSWLMSNSESNGVGSFWRKIWERHYQRYMEFLWTHNLVTQLTGFFGLVSVLLQLTTWSIKAIANPSFFSSFVKIIDCGLDATTEHEVSVCLSFHQQALKIIRTKQERADDLAAFYFSPATNYHVGLISKLLSELYFGAQMFRQKILEILFDLFHVRPDCLRETALLVPCFGPIAEQLHLLFAELLEKKTSKLIPQTAKDLLKSLKLE